MTSFTVPMMFPGQASQFVGMANDLVGSQGPAGEFLAQANETLGLDLLSIMLEGPRERLTETRNAQPAILAHSVAVILALQEREIQPRIVAGHSLGEFSAAVACGALCPFDALRTVRRRGELMFTAGEAYPGTMAAVMGLGAQAVEEICATTPGVVVVANHNSPNQVVISGEIAAVKAAGEGLTARGARRVIPLNVSGAFHSPLLEEVAREFCLFLEQVPVQDPLVPLVANVSATAVTSGEALRQGFARQLTSPVLWHDSLELLAARAGNRGVVLEVGPGKVLTNLAKRVHPEVQFLSVASLSELDEVAVRIKNGG